MNFSSRTSITDFNEHADTNFGTNLRTPMSAGTRGQKKFQNADKDIKNADMDI